MYYYLDHNKPLKHKGISLVLGKIRALFDDKMLTKILITMSFVNVFFFDVDHHHDHVETSCKIYKRIANDSS